MTETTLALDLAAGFQVRPVEPQDAPAITSLHPEFRMGEVRDLIAESARAVGGEERSPLRQMFVLCGGGSLLGAAGLVSSMGTDFPRYSFRVGKVVHASAEMSMFHEAATLVLGNDHTGATELLAPVMARGAAPELQGLLLAAMVLVVRGAPGRFGQSLVCELPGMRYQGGGSPFWDALGRHFYRGEQPSELPFFPTPLRSHVGRLMPKHPLYSAMLEARGQACIGQRGLGARLLDEMLRAHGFRPRGHVSIFDGGPLVELQLDAPPVSPLIRRLPVELAPSAPREGPLHLVANGADGAVQRVLATTAAATDSVQLTPQQAGLLGLRAGDLVQVMAHGQ